jgi:hypothetical protein
LWHHPDGPACPHSVRCRSRPEEICSP